MFGKKQKIEVRIEGRAPRPVSRRIVSDIMPARGMVGKTPAKIAVKSVPSAAPAVIKAAVPASVKTTQPRAKGRSAQAEMLDFLTRRPMVDGAIPKLPKRPGVSFDFQKRLNDLKVLLRPAAEREEEGDGVVTVAAPRRVSAKLATIGFVAALIMIFGGGFFALNVFSSVTVNIAPKAEMVTVDKTFTVAKSGGAIAGELMTFRQVVEASKETTGQLDANSKARGRIVIYNNYSAEPQTLVKRTRFETPEGKVYRLLDGVIVPGISTKSGQSTPGSIEVAVEADQSGEEYNIGLADFTIPGFKGTARYTKFYGRSKTPMAGGSTSRKRVTARADIDELKAGLAAKLEETIKSEYGSKVPEGFKLLDGAYAIGYEEAVANPPLDGEGDSVTVALAGNFRGLLIKKELLAEAIGAAYGKDGLAKKAHVANVDDLTISVVRKDLEANEMTIHVSGQARFVWNIDEATIVGEFLAGKSSVEIFGAHEGIEKAEVAFSPSWWHFIPKNKDRIYIKLTK